MRKATLLRLSLVISLLGLILSPIFTWGDRCLEGNCVDGRGIGFADNGGLFDGNWQEGKPHGEGALSFKGAKYKGTWTEGRLNGFGVYHLPDGTYYEGNFRNDLFHGQGRQQLPDGTILEGEWKNGALVK